MQQILFLISGARSGGNSETLARAAAATLPSVTGQQWLRLADHPLPAFEDIRHDSTRDYEHPTGHAGVLLDATLGATDIVFIAPLYWYGLPAAAKLYLDHWSGWLRLAGVNFKARMSGKTAWVVSAYSDPDPLFVDPLIRTLELTADYMSMNWGGALLGKGNEPGDVLRDEVALRQATSFFAGAASLAVAAN